jgi:hypothetical protein
MMTPVTQKIYSILIYDPHNTKDLTSKEKNMWKLYNMFCPPN